MATCYAVLLFLCRGMVCPSPSCFSSPTKFQMIWIFCRRWPINLSGAWTIIFFTNSLTIVGVSSVIPTYFRTTASVSSFCSRYIVLIDTLENPVKFRHPLFCLDFQIITPHAGHILDDNRFDLSHFCEAYHPIPARPVESHSRNAVVNEKGWIGKSVVCRILQKDFLLVGYAVALPVERVLLT